MNKWEWNLLEDKATLDQVEIGGVTVRVGDRVRLHPKEDGDILDIALRGQIATGHNPTIAIRTFSGEVEFDPETPQACGLHLAIQAASLSIQDDVSDKDRREMERMMNGEVLEVGKYPEIRYDASAIAVTRLGDTMFSVTLNGDLRFRGLTRTQPLTARITTMGEMLRASGEFTLKQSDYEIKPVSVAGGALRLKDELKFSFEIVAQGQQTAA